MSAPFLRPPHPHLQANSEESKCSDSNIYIIILSYLPQPLPPLRPPLPLPHLAIGSTSFPSIFVGFVYSTENLNQDIHNGHNVDHIRKRNPQYSEGRHTNWGSIFQNFVMNFLIVHRHNYSSSCGSSASNSVKVGRNLLPAKTSSRMSKHFLHTLSLQSENAVPSLLNFSSVLPL